MDTSKTIYQGDEAGTGLQFGLSSDRKTILVYCEWAKRVEVGGFSSLEFRGTNFEIPMKDMIELQTG